jgi:hypothetical protein
VLPDERTNTLLQGAKHSYERLSKSLYLANGNRIFGFIVTASGGSVQTVGWCFLAFRERTDVCPSGSLQSLIADLTTAIGVV